MEWTHWINHELKAPLNRMESLVLSLEKSPNCGYDETKLLRMLRESLLDCRRTLDSLYLYNQIDKNQIQPQFEHVDVNKLISQAIKEVEHLSLFKKVEIISEMEALFPVELDEQLFKRAFLNILDNAIKYSPEGTKVLISTELVKNSLVVQVADQGEGITQDELKQIFDPYYRVPKTSHLPGTGLGLYIAQSFIKHHNGTLDVDSVLKSGTTFTIEIPQSRGGDEEI